MLMKTILNYTILGLMLVACVPPKSPLNEIPAEKRRVLSVSPGSLSGLEEGVPLDIEVLINFSSDIDAKDFSEVESPQALLELRVAEDGDMGTNLVSQLDMSDVAHEGEQLRIDFSAKLQLDADTEYMVNFIDQTWAESATWSFRTRAPVDDEAPKLIETSPEEGAEDVDIDAPLTLDFDEMLDPESDFELSLEYQLSAEIWMSIEAEVEVSDAALEVVPSLELPAGAQIRVRVVGISDLVGNTTSEADVLYFSTRNREIQNDEAYTQTFKTDSIISSLSVVESRTSRVVDVVFSIRSDLESTIRRGSFEHKTGEFSAPEAISDTIMLPSSNNKFSDVRPTKPADDGRYALAFSHERPTETEFFLKALKFGEEAEEAVSVFVGDAISTSAVKRGPAPSLSNSGAGIFEFIDVDEDELANSCEHIAFELFSDLSFEFSDFETIEYNPFSVVPNFCLKSMSDPAGNRYLLWMSEERELYVSIRNFNALTWNSPLLLSAGPISGSVGGVSYSIGNTAMVPIPTTQSVAVFWSGHRDGRSQFSARVINLEDGSLGPEIAIDENIEDAKPNALQMMVDFNAEGEGVVTWLQKSPLFASSQFFGRRLNNKAEPTGPRVLLSDITENPANNYTLALNIDRYGQIRFHYLSEYLMAEGAEKDEVTLSETRFTPWSNWSEPQVQYRRQGVQRLSNALSAGNRWGETVFALYIDDVTSEPPRRELVLLPYH